MNLIKKNRRCFDVGALLFIGLMLLCHSNWARAEWDVGGIVIPAYSNSPQRACEYLSIHRVGHVLPYRLGWLSTLRGSNSGGFYAPGSDVPGPPIPNAENNYTPQTPDSRMFCIMEETLANQLFYYPDPKIIAIDPGHGGTKCADGGKKTGGDTGTTGPTYKDTEHALALSIGLSLRDKLVSKGYKVIMTRTTAECPSLEERARIANIAKADLFVSIHFNGVDDRNANGTEVHTLKKNTPGWLIATSTSEKVSSVLGTMDRGPKASNLSVLRNTRMPSVLLEVAFLSNVGGDEDIMHRPASVVDAASAIASSVDAFLNK